MVLYDIALSMVPQLGPLNGKRLIETFGSAEAVLKADPLDIAIATDTPTPVIKRIEFHKEFPTAEKELLYMEQNGIRAISLSSEEYPIRLRECDDPPLVLYVKGDFDFNSGRWLSVVGTRKPTRYGRDMTTRLISGLADICPGTVIVSGLAYGIDIQAHLAALGSGLKTVAVLGNSLGSIYPREHGEYADRIVEHGGALISEFHSKHPVLKANFLRRNRIIAGISEGTLVVESAARGGSLSTANHAFHYNREVMAVPGRVGDPLSAGTNGLIRQDKARIITRTEDIMEYLDWESFAEQTEQINEQPSLFSDSIDSTEKLLLETITREGPISADQLTVITNLPISRINVVTLNMEIKGFIRRNPGNTYEIA